MNTDEIPKYVNALLQQVIRELELKDYSLCINQGSQPGDGFASEIFSGTITENPKNKKLIILCKIAPRNVAHRKVFALEFAFKRETFFYTEIMPTFVQFQRERNLPEKEQFSSYPKCYAAIAEDESEQYAIIMDDLRPQGYKMWDKSKPASIDNMRVLLSELGKFHGLSISMKDQRPEEFAKFKQVKDFRRSLYRTGNMRGMCDAIFDRAINSLKNPDHKVIMDNLKKNFIPYLDNCYDETASDRFGVICHGDFWNNNILQRFNDFNITEDLRIVDWQSVQYASPAIDLLYNIFSSTDKALLGTKYDDLLMCYHESLSNMVEILGSNPEKLFTFEDLNGEMKRCGNFALLMAPMLIQISQADSNEAPDFDEMFEKMSNGETNQEFITGLSTEGQLKYDQQINDVVEHIIELGYFSKKY